MVESTGDNRSGDQHQESAARKLQGTQVSSTAPNTTLKNFPTDLLHFNAMMKLNTQILAIHLFCSWRI